MATPKSAAAATLVWVQAALVALGGLILLAAGARRRRSLSTRFLHGHLVGHPGLWGLALVIVAAGLVLLGIGVHRRSANAVVTAYITEAVLGLGGLVGFHPVRSVLGVMLAVMVVALISTDERMPQPS